jgi:hypothetical protein
MKGKLSCPLVLLALIVGMEVHAQTPTNITGVYPNTNIVESVQIGFAQGTCNDGTNVYVALTSAIQRRNINSGPILGGILPWDGITNGLSDHFPLIHLGDPDCYQGCIYVPMENAVGAPKGAAIIDVAIFKTSLIRCAAVSISNYQSEVSAVCIDPVLSNSVALFATSYVSGSTNDGIYEYRVNNLTNLAFVKALPLTQNLRHIQGVVCVGGMLYVLADNGPAGEVYQVNPTNGVVVDLAKISIAGNIEWEGLDYNQGFLVANEGATGTVNWFDFFGVLNATTNLAISGSVMDSNDNPIVGVGVSATAFINGTIQVATANTGTNGNYSLIVTNGTWSVTVNYNNATNSLNSLGNYFPPNSQFISLANNNATANFMVQICTGVSITTPSPLPTGEVGVFYSQTLQASSCNPVFTWTNTDDSLPPGMSLSSGGVLSGTPSGPGGVFNFIVQVTDGNNAATNQSFSIGISNAVQITTTSLPGGTNISFYSAALSAGNGQPSYTWSLSPASAGLPANLSLTANGLLSGTPITYGVFNFSVRVTDTLTGVADQPLALNLAPADPPAPAISVPGGQTPPLAISVIDGEIFVFWSASATNYVMQTTTNISASNWVTVSDAVPGTAYNVTNTALQQYFRLQ